MMQLPSRLNLLYILCRFVRWLMPNQKFTYLIDSFKGLNTFASSSDVSPEEATELLNLVVRPGKLILADSVLNPRKKPKTAGSMFRC